MPPASPEASEWRGQAAQEAVRAELRYISRRRADAEDPENLIARETFPEPIQTPRLQAKPTRVAGDWPEGAPPPPISIEQLFYPGVYAGIQRTVAAIAEQLRAAEDRVRQGGEPEAISGRIQELYTELHAASRIGRAGESGTRGFQRTACRCDRFRKKSRRPTICALSSSRSGAAASAGRTRTCSTGP